MTHVEQVFWKKKIKTHEMLFRMNFLK